MQEQFVKKADMNREWRKQGERGFMFKGKDVIMSGEVEKKKTKAEQKER